VIVFYYPTTTAKQIAAALGNASDDGNGWHRCTCPAHDDKRPSLCLKDGDKGGLKIKCWAGCSRDAVERILLERGLLSLLRPGTLPPPTITVDAGKDKRAEKLQRLARNITPIKDTPGDLYLHHRLAPFVLPQYPADLVYRSHAWKNDDGMWAHCIVALCRDADGKVTAALLRYVDDKGNEARLIHNGREYQAKQTRGIPKGSAFRLPGRRPILVCEGTTTALALWIALGHETWAVGGWANLLYTPLSMDAKSVIVFGDNDADGADQQLEDYYTDAVEAFAAQDGLKLAFTRPLQPGYDAADVLTKGGGVEELHRLVYQTAIVFEPGELLSFDYRLFNEFSKRGGASV
jgi:hypothetical protein